MSQMIIHQGQRPAILQPGATPQEGFNQSRARAESPIHPNGPGRWPLGYFCKSSPGALPQAVIGRAFGPDKPLRLSAEEGPGEVIRIFDKSNFLRRPPRGSTAILLGTRS